MLRCRPAPLHALTALALATLLAAPAAATQAEKSPRTPSVTPAPTPAADPLLPRPLGGEAALARLGDDLDKAAARNDLTPKTLRGLLTEDASVRLDTAGRVHFLDPVHSGPVGGPTAAPFEAPAPLSDTFLLHSRPGASRVVFLDFDGATVSGTAWNTPAPQGPGVGTSHPAWDPAGDGPSFSESERTQIQLVWSLVAEDFAAWDVDVTTQDPGADGLVRSTSADTTYGSHVLISPSTDAAGKICGGSCGGVAYLDVFGELGKTHQPAWVFPQALGHSARNVGEVVSHEVGHNLALSHDGLDGSSYYTGHGEWAPIMGAGYYRPVVQWSRGSYPGATNQQDDLAVIGERLSLRADESGPGAPGPLPTGPAFITSAADVDTYDLGSCTAGATVSVSPAALSPDLDVSLTLRDEAGTVLAKDDPASTNGDGTTAAGMSAAATLDVATEAVTLSVDGAGSGDWATGGYDDYASIGAYTVAVSGCTDEDPADPGGSGDPENPGSPEDPPPPAPGVPSDVVASRGDRQATVTWRAPSGGGTVAGYVVSTLPDGPTIQVTGADTTSTTVLGLTNGTAYRFDVVATGPDGESAKASRSEQVVPAGVPLGVDRPRLRTRPGRLVIRWAEAEANGAPIERYRVIVRGAARRIVDRTGRRAVVRNLPTGRYRVRVAAWNEVGRSTNSPTARIRLR